VPGSGVADAVSPFAVRVRAVVAATRPGDVLSYGEVAAEAGVPGAARAVGRVLAAHGSDVPWWRVVTAQGRLVPGREHDHARRLAAEGVPCRNGRVLRRGDGAPDATRGQDVR
jgi:methylated-DNA-protein-cysteine methyltransferase related protein